MQRIFLSLSWFVFMFVAAARAQVTMGSSIGPDAEAGVGGGEFECFGGTATCVFSNGNWMTAAHVALGDGALSQGQEMVNPALANFTMCNPGSTVLNGVGIDVENIGFTVSGTNVQDAGIIYGPGEVSAAIAYSVGVPSNRPALLYPSNGKLAFVGATTGLERGTFTQVVSGYHAGGTFQKLVQFTALCNNGDSGAPVFTDDSTCHQEIGMLEGGDGVGYSYAVPITLTLNALGYTLAGTNTCTNFDWICPNSKYCYVKPNGTCVCSPPSVVSDAPSLERIAGAMSTPTPGSQDPRFPMAEVPQRPGQRLSPEVESQLRKATELTQSPEFQQEMTNKLDALNLHPVYYGESAKGNQVMIEIAVSDSLTPEIEDKFNRFTHGIGGDFPVKLVQRHPIISGKDFLRRRIVGKPNQ